MKRHLQHLKSAARYVTCSGLEVINAAMLSFVEEVDSARELTRTTFQLYTVLFGMRSNDSGINWSARSD